MKSIKDNNSPKQNIDTTYSTRHADRATVQNEEVSLEALDGLDSALLWNQVEQQVKQWGGQSLSGEVNVYTDVEVSENILAIKAVTDLLQQIKRLLEEDSFLNNAFLQRLVVQVHTLLKVKTYKDRLYVLVAHF